ncbi:response regulator [Terracidiphilus sp.]|jgi:DNA-binding NtrC family response regulator|uniref:response regulator n=1 Tax=Terracidiphilus sp. TaxID=1964191 RepID=UPI003C23B9B8
MMTTTRKVVFVVDDERVIADTLALILKQDGYDAKPFYSGESAMREGELSPPQLLISDVAMPGMSGIDLAIYFRRRHPDCKVLLFSGQANTAHLLKKAGGEGYRFEIVSKPIHPADLLTKLRHAELELVNYSSVLENAQLVKELVK